GLGRGTEPSHERARQEEREATTMADQSSRALGVTSRNARSLGARAAALACGGMLLLAACGGPPDRPAAQPTTSSRPRTPAESCALQVGYWAVEVLKPDYNEYGDYQKMGLTAAYYQLVLDISKEARQLRKTATREQTLAFIDREAKRRCAEKATTTCTTATHNGWPC
ncbi:MAG TPA: hypothetical protein VGQ92_10580, partial [Actinoplanes sp.]|nr:hypothetical protein [Actinoplanes sp.]